MHYTQILIGVLVLAAACGQRRELPSSFYADLHSVNGRKFRLADIADKPILLIFWTRACKSCSEIAKTAAQTETPGEVILVSVDAELDEAGVQDSAAALGLKGTAVLDRDLKLVQALEIESHPALLLVLPTKNGVLLQREYDLESGAAGGKQRILTSFVTAQK